MAENITLQQAFDELISGGVTPELPLTKGYQESAMPLAGQSLAAIYEYFKEGITGPIERTMAPLYDKNAQQPTLEDIFMATTMGVGAGWKGGLPAGATGVGMTRALHGAAPGKELFSKFSKDFIGTGEGGAARGYGFYFSDVRDITEVYAKKGMQTEEAGNIYNVTLHPHKVKENWLEWDEALSETNRVQILNELLMQSKRDLRLESYIRSEKDVSGGDIYHSLQNKFGSKKAVSEFLDRVGIDGIRFEAGSIMGPKPQIIKKELKSLTKEQLAQIDPDNSGLQFYKDKNIIIDNLKEGYELEFWHKKAKELGFLPEQYNYVIFNPEHIEINAIEDIAGNVIKDFRKGDKVVDVPMKEIDLADFEMD